MVQKLQDTRRYSTKLHMKHYSTFLYGTSLLCRCQISYTSCVLETSILLPPPSMLFQNISTSPSSSSRLYRHGPQR